jgi:hypothetical protein
MSSGRIITSQTTRVPSGSVTTLVFSASIPEGSPEQPDSRTISATPMNPAQDR